MSSTAKRLLLWATLFAVVVVLWTTFRDLESASPPAQRAALDLSSFELVDLTHAYDADTLYWPTSTEKFELEELAFGPTEGGWFYSSYSYSSPEHGGTHLDAPIHFAEGGRSVDQIPLEQLVVLAKINLQRR